MAIEETRHEIIYLRMYYYHWVDSSAGGVYIRVVIIRLSNQCFDTDMVY